MAPRPKPWLRKGRGYFVQIDGKQVNLGTKDKKVAYERYHELMADLASPASAPDAILLSTLLDEFLEWTSKHRAPATYDTCRTRLQAFLDSVPRGLVAGELKAFHVQKWADSHPEWKANTVRTAIATVQRAFNWGVSMGYLSTNPVRHIEKPSREPRDKVVTQEEFDDLLSYVPDPQFRDLLLVHWHTGCRPQESLRVEARYVDLEHSRWVFPPAKSKGKRRPRIVYLNDDALSITKRNMQLWPEGPIFRNTRSRPWTKDAVNCRMERLSKKRVREKVCAYHLRHSWCQRLLEKGVDSLTVGILMGHQNANMVSSTYQHLNHNPVHLLQQLRSASG